MGDLSSYMDNVIVIAKSWFQLTECLKQDLAWFGRLAGRQIAHQKVSFLWHHVSPEGVRPDPILMLTVCDIQPPTSQQELCNVFRLASLLRKFHKES